MCIRNTRHRIHIRSKPILPPCHLVEASCLWAALCTQLVFLRGEPPSFSPSCLWNAEITYVHPTFSPLCGFPEAHRLSGLCGSHFYLQNDLTGPLIFLSYLLWGMYACCPLFLKIYFIHLCIATWRWEDSYEGDTCFVTMRGWNSCIRLGCTNAFTGPAISRDLFFFH